MKWSILKKPNRAYRPPAIRAHRGFAYLNDDIVINGLSALESGKVDEVVEKISLASDRGRSVSVGGEISGASAKAEATGKVSESLQAEVIRRRTRFSIFELWYQALVRRRGIGTFDRWDSSSLEGVEAGHIIELRGRVEIVPLQTGLRAYLWFVNELKSGNSIFGKVDLSDHKKSEAIVKFLLGKRDEISATLKPDGHNGPKVAMTFEKSWTIESISRWNGVFTLVAQVEEVLQEGQTWQTMRIIEDAPLTPLEARTLEGAVAPFKDGFKDLGIDLDETPTYLSGPALVLRPIAVYR